MSLPFTPTSWPHIEEWCRKLAESINYMLAPSRLGDIFSRGRVVVDTEGATSNQVSALWKGTVAEYGALTPSATTVYVTTDTPHIYVGGTLIV